MKRRKLLAFCSVFLFTPTSEAISNSSSSGVKFVLPNWHQGATRIMMRLGGIPEIVKGTVRSNGAINVQLPTPKTNDRGELILSPQPDIKPQLKNLLWDVCPKAAQQAKVSDPTVASYSTYMEAYVKTKKGLIGLSNHDINGETYGYKKPSLVEADLVYSAKPASYKLNIKDCGDNAYMKAVTADINLNAGWNIVIVSVSVKDNIITQANFKSLPNDKPLELLYSDWTVKPNSIINKDFRKAVEWLLNPS